MSKIKEIAMSEPKVLSFRSKDGNNCVDIPDAVLVEKRNHRSKVFVKADKAAEICGKTPSAIPVND